MKKIVYFFIISYCIGYVFPASAENQIVIFEVQKNLKLSNDEPDFKDYYISGGFENGLKPGMVIDVVRKIPLHDNVKNQAKGELRLNIAKVKVLHVQNRVAVARYYKGTSDNSRPLIQFNAIMVGDSLDMSTAVMARKRASKKSKTASSKIKTGSAVEKVKRKPAQQIVGPPVASVKSPAVSLNGEMTLNK